MNFDTWLIYVLTILAMMSTPGPSQLLMLANCARHGFARGVSTAAGDLTANMGQMLAAGLGLAALISASATALTVIKWAGVAYLIWMGTRMILGAGRSSKIDALPVPRRRALWMQGFLTSAANPKAVVFFAALFPQFISSDAAFWPQFLILSATYLAIDGLFLAAYGLSAAKLAAHLTGSGRLWLDRIGGGFILVAALLLGLKSLDATPNQ